MEVDHSRELIDVDELNQADTCEDSSEIGELIESTVMAPDGRTIHKRTLCAFLSMHSKLPLDRIFRVQRSTPIAKKLTEHIPFQETPVPSDCGGEMDILEEKLAPRNSKEPHQYLVKYVNETMPAQWITHQQLRKFFQGTDALVRKFEASFNKK